MIYQRKTFSICDACGKEFYVSPSVTKRGKGKFCSRNCYVSFRKGFALYWGKPAKYNTKHKYMQRHWDKPEKCAVCGEKKKLDWANISGKYFDDRNDYKAMCRRCHTLFDRERIFITKEGLFCSVFNFYKKCNMCGKTLHYTNFYFQNKITYKLKSICKKCEVKRVAKYTKKSTKLPCS